MVVACIVLVDCKGAESGPARLASEARSPTIRGRTRLPLPRMQPELIDPLGQTARVVRTVVFIDVVESVRLIEEHEEEAIRRWRGLVDQVETQVASALEGRVVKSLGDGLMLEFGRVADAIKAAFAIQSICRIA